MAVPRNQTGHRASTPKRMRPRLPRRWHGCLGRVPEDELLAQLRQRSGLTVLAAGDSRSPRGLEEAILEGTLAARQAFDGDDVPGSPAQDGEIHTGDDQAISPSSSVTRA
jgi:hypothetical protein